MQETIPILTLSMSSLPYEKFTFKRIESIRAHPEAPRGRPDPG